MFAQLTHEALHAYLDQYVLDPAGSRPPRWLHEGLALLLESGRIEGETLRIDAPHPAMLLELQAELRNGQPLSLAEYLEKGEQTVFRVLFANPDSRRTYAYAWGLAYYLTFQKGLLTGDELLEYGRLLKHLHLRSMSLSNWLASLCPHSSPPGGRPFCNKNRLVE